MFSKPLNTELKSKIYDGLRGNPEASVIKLRDMLEREVEENHFETIKEFIRILKFMMKDKIPAKPKFYALLLIKEIMEFQKEPIVEYFMKKLMSRLFLIAQFDMKNPDINRGERCLKKYYGQESKENSDYSLKFFMLLLECWKHWDSLYAAKHKKIKEKCDKLRSLFPVNDIYYDYIDRSASKQNRTHHQNVVFKSISEMPGDYHPNDSLGPRSRFSIDSSEDINPIRHNIKESNSSFSRQPVKGLESAHEIRHGLNEFLQANNDDAFYELYTHFYKTIQNEASNLTKNKPSIMKSPAFDENAKSKYNNEITALNTLIDNLDKFGRDEIKYNDLRSQVAILEKKYPVLLAVKPASKSQGVFLKNQIGNSKGPEEDEKIHELNTVKSYSEDLNFSNKKRNNQISEGRSPETFKSHAGQSAHTKTFGPNFGIMEESNEDDSNIVKMSNEPGSSRVMADSMDHREMKWRTSIDHNDANFGSSRNVKNDISTPKNAKGNDTWAFNFDNMKRPETNEDTDFGQFEGFGRNHKSLTHRSEPSKTPVNMSNSAKKNTSGSRGKTQASGFTQQEPELSDEPEVHRKNLQLNKEHMRSRALDDTPLMDTPVFHHDNIRMNTIIEESREDFDESRRSSSRIFDPRNARSVKQHSDISKTGTDDGADNNIQIKFDDFQDIESSIGRPSDDGRLVRSEINKHFKTAETRAKDSGINQKLHASTRISDSRAKDVSTANQKVGKSVTTLSNSESADFAKVQSVAKKTAAQAQNLKNRKSAKYHDAFLEELRNEPIQEEEPEPHFAQFSGQKSNKGKNPVQLSQGPREKTTQAQAGSNKKEIEEDLFKTNNNFNFNFDDFGTKKSIKDNMLEEIQETKYSFGFHDFGSNRKFEKESQASNRNLTHDSKVHSTFRHAEENQKDSSYANYDFEFRDSGMHTLEKDRDDRFSKKDEKQPRLSAGFPAAYMGSEKKLDSAFKQDSIPEHSYKDTFASDHNLDTKTQTLKGFTMTDLRRGEWEEPKLMPTRQNINFDQYAPKSEESKDQFEDVIEEESEHYKYNLRKQMHEQNSPSSNYNSQNAKPTATFSKTRNQLSSEKAFAEANSFHVNTSRAGEQDRDDEMLKIGEALSKHSGYNDQTSRGITEEFDAGQFIQPNLDQNPTQQNRRHDITTDPGREIANFVLPKTEQLGNLSTSTPNIPNSGFENLAEKIIKVRKQGQMIPDIASSLGRENVGGAIQRVDESQIREISELKVTNEFLRQQCDLLFNQLMEKQREVAGSTSGSNRNLQNTGLEVDLTEVEGKIFQRKNEFLAKENQMLKKVNNSLLTSTKKRKQKKEEQTILYGRLNQELELYITELKDELGKLIRAREGQERLESRLSSQIEKPNQEVQLRNHEDQGHVQKPSRRFQ